MKSTYSHHPKSNPRRLSSLALSGLAVGFAAALWLSGCASVVNQMVPFNEADFQPYQTSGTAQIRGHAFVRSDTGVKHGAAGLKIFLVPRTAYTEERAAIMESGKEPGPADPRLDAYARTTVGDWGGAYKFEHLPAGSYLIYCKIEWQAQFLGTMRRDADGAIYAVGRAELLAGEQKEVVVTNAKAK